jgi:hypothetical protein
MGEFHDAVSTLLQAFAHGISIIKTQRGRRKKEKVPIDSSRKIAESHLSKSLKKNRKDVKNAYERDVALLGPGFAVGDGLSFIPESIAHELIGPQRKHTLPSPPFSCA